MAILVSRCVTDDGDPDVDGSLWRRLPLDGIGYIDLEEDPVAPDYRTFAAATAMHLRAVEHLLRLTTPAATPRGTT